MTTTMPRQAKTPDTRTYSGRMAARLRTLRHKAGLSVAELRERMEQHGAPIGLSTVYAYENGSRLINPDHYPALAKSVGVPVRSLFPAD